MALSITKELESTLRSAFAEAKARRHEHVTLEHLPEGVVRDPEQTRAFQRVLERAAMQVQSSGKQQIDGGNVLVAFYRERDSHAVYLLERQGISRLDLLRTISHGAIKVRDPSSLTPMEKADDDATDHERDRRRDGPNPA